MTGRPDDASVPDLLEENLRLTVELQLMTAAYGAAQLKIAHLERLLADQPSNQRRREFDRMREAALENGKRGVYQP